MNLKANLDLLKKYQWIHDFQVTEIFCHNLFENHFPEEWIEFFNKLEFVHIGKIVTEKEYFKSYEIQKFEMPNDLIEFLENAKEIYFRSQYEKLPFVQFKNIPGLTYKKSYELQTMLPSIIDLCKKHNCQYIIDIGSGIGNFDELLANHIDITVIGIEMSQDFIAKANKRQSEIFKTKRILNICHKVSENSENELMEIIKQKISNNLNIENLDDSNFGLISLHSCGDLTPNILRIYIKNKSNIKFLLTFGCCYHKMQPKSNESNEFKNFPLSNYLKTLIQNEYPSLNLSKFSLRLGAQQTISTWKYKKNEDYEEHINQVAFRGIIEKFCNDNKLEFNKLKRKLASKAEFKSFKTYVEYIEERSEFKDKDGNQIKIIDLYDKLMPYYSKFEKYFKAIEYLTALQSILQPVIENLIHLDRKKFLNEFDINSRLVQFFDDSVSPRSICILSEKFS